MDSVKYVHNWLSESYDPGDMWGSAMTAGFAVCDAITVLDGNVPAELHYRPATGFGRAALEHDEFEAARELMALVENPSSVAVPGYPDISVKTLEKVAAGMNELIESIPESDRY